MKRTYDKPFFLTILALVILGIFIFTSASLGLLAKEGATFGSVAKSQILFGLLGGSIAALITSRIKYTFWKKHAFFILLSAIILSLLVFVPQLGFGHGGARRWVDLGFITFQPSEFLKFAFIIYFAAWLSSIQKKISSFNYTIIPFFVIMAILGGILFLQTDIDVIVIIFLIGLVLLYSAGVKWKHLLVILLLASFVFGAIAYSKPHVISRIQTFIDPTEDSQGAAYQIQQSLIAIGSGGISGRGFGQSVQKFNFLPEPIGDSIFAVYAEEFGFIGSVGLVLLFLFLALRGLKISSRAPDTFARLTVIGIVILIVMQSLLNIGAMLSLVPLIGTPLLFVSHGGTALFVTLAEIGIVLNISKYSK
ncbi:MAG: FtsW/RodA/SpoVE family cell cycle protein [Candidatus Pacebacteria bacterium]|nr:FtsW/RodA/SpoVE family cell cycle protein [Candidatus Paceibacterota bacterium]